MADGRVAIIDTELKGFAFGEKENRSWGLYKLINRFPMDQNAHQYVKKEIQHEEDSIELRKWVKEELKKEGSLDLLKIYEERHTRYFDHNTLYS